MPKDLNMSILNKLKTLSPAKAEAGRVPMTEEQFAACKAAIRNKSRGYNVHPNKFDVAKPYRVAINYNNEWANFGEFSSPDVAAAVGTIVSAAYFGSKAKAGQFDQEVAEASDEFKSWLADERNTIVIAQASGDKPQVHQPRFNDEPSF